MFIQNHFQRVALITTTSIWFFLPLSITNWITDGCLPQNTQSGSWSSAWYKGVEKTIRFFHLGIFCLVQQIYQESHGLEGDQREHYIICKDKYKLKRRGLILPVENKGRNCPPLLFPWTFYFRNVADTFSSLWNVNKFFWRPHWHFVSFDLGMSSSRTWKPFLWNVNIKADRTPISPFLWENGGLTSLIGHLAPTCITTSCNKDMRSLYSLWIKPISSHKWSPHLPGNVMISYVWQIVLSTSLNWGLVIVYLKTCMYWVISVSLYKRGEILVCFCKLLEVFLWCVSYSGVVLIQ